MKRIVAASIASLTFALALGLDSRRGESASDTSARAEAVGAVSPVSARDDADSHPGAAITPALPEVAAIALQASSIPTTGADAEGADVAQSTAPTSRVPIAQTLTPPQIAVVPPPKPAAAAATTEARAQDAREKTQRAVRERQLSEIQREAATAAFAPNEIVNGETVRGGGAGGSGEMTIVQPAGGY